MSTSPLSRYKVLDASESIAGQYAGRLLADYGAEVVLLEPPEGSVIRGIGPFAGGTGQAPRESLLFAHLNGGKASTVSDVGGPGATATLLELAGRADAVIVGDHATASEVRRAHADVLVAVVTDFGSDGEYSDWLGSELIHQALSGSMYVTGLADREPLYGVGHRASYSAGLSAYIAILSALHQRADTGDGPSQVEVAVHEAAASMEQNFSTQYAYNGTLPRRDDKSRPRGRARCSDGWVVYFVRNRQWPEFCEAFGAPELVDDPRFADWGDLVRNWSEASEELHARAGKLTVADLIAAADRLKLVLAPMLPPGALHREEHLQGRGFWQSVDGPRPPHVALGPVFRTSKTPCDRARPAPALGDWIDDWGPKDARRDRPSGQPGRRPLEGIRVLDFSSAWAGPMATRILASLGAEVIKVEGPGRVDAWRGEHKDPPSLHNYPDLDGGARPYNRHAWFNSQNHDKHSLVLDIKNPQAVELLHEIVLGVDIVLANWSPGALARAGFGYEQLVELNPSVIVVEMPAISNSGPLAQQRGLGPTMEAMAGIAALIGYADGAPLGSGTAYLDPIGALHGASAALTALVHRDLTGDGQHVEVPQREAAMHWIGELILDSIENGVERHATGNAVAHASPHGAFPAAGEDEWIAIGVETDQQWKALCLELGTEGLAADHRFSAASDRVSNREELEALIGKETAAHDKHELARRLQAAGVPAAPVANGRDLHHDPQLRAREWFCALEHADAGRHEYPGLPIVVDGRRMQPRWLSPRFGEHTNDVLSRLVGLEEGDLEDLANLSVTADRPRGA